MCTAGPTVSAQFLTPIALEKMKTLVKKLLPDGITLQVGLGDEVEPVVLTVKQDENTVSITGPTRMIGELIVDKMDATWDGDSQTITIPVTDKQDGDQAIGALHDLFEIYDYVMLRLWYQPYRAQPSTPPTPHATTTDHDVAEAEAYESEKLDQAHRQKLIDQARELWARE